MRILVWKYLGIFSSDYTVRFFCVCKMLEILKGIHESTFKDHKVIIEEG